MGRRRSAWRRGGLAAAVLGAVSLALAQAAAAQDVTALSPQETADEQLVQSVYKVGTFEAIRSHLADLQAVLDRAPASYPAVVVGKGVTLVRENGGFSTADLALLVGAAKDKHDMRLVRQFNTYPTAAFLIGSYDNELKQPDAAIAVMDRGLKLQPQNSDLVAEKAAALFTRRRFAEAFAMIQSWLAANPPATRVDRARLLRADGLALTELGRLDEAEAAYRESLTLSPGHKGALDELDYIAKLRTGGRTAAVGITTGDKAQDVGRAAIQAPPKP